MSLIIGGIEWQLSFGKSQGALLDEINIRIAKEVKYLILLWCTFILTLFEFPVFINLFKIKISLSMAF